MLQYLGEVDGVREKKLRNPLVEDCRFEKKQSSRAGVKNRNMIMKWTIATSYAEERYL